jgi:hypothetical protein
MTKEHYPVTEYQPTLPIELQPKPDPEEEAFEAIEREVDTQPTSYYVARLQRGHEPEEDNPKGGFDFPSWLSQPAEQQRTNQEGLAAAKRALAEKRAQSNNE